MSKLVQKPNPEFGTRWTQLSGALNEVCDLVLSRKVASAGAIKDCKSQMAWYNVVYGMCTQGSGQLNQHSIVHDRLRKVTGLLRLFPSSVSKRKTRNSAVSLSF